MPKIKNGFQYWTWKFTTIVFSCFISVGEELHSAFQMHKATQKFEKSLEREKVNLKANDKSYDDLR